MENVEVMWEMGEWNLIEGCKDRWGLGEEQGLICFESGIVN